MSRLFYVLFKVSAKRQAFQVACHHLKTLVGALPQQSIFCKLVLQKICNCVHSCPACRLYQDFTIQTASNANVNTLADFLRFALRSNHKRLLVGASPNSATSGQLGPEWYCGLSEKKAIKKAQKNTFVNLSVKSYSVLICGNSAIHFSPSTILKYLILFKSTGNTLCRRYVATIHELKMQMWSKGIA